jgi:hypothetical protein
MSRPSTSSKDESVAIEPINALRPAVLVEAGEAAQADPGSAFAALLDSANHSLARADAAAASLAAGTGSVAEAAVARAKADVELEVAAIAASRASNAIATLLQTQV